MIRRNRIPVALVILIAGCCFALPLIGCSSSSDGGSAGNGGSGGNGGDATLRILVTNDDGVAAPGIDAIVEALRTDPNNVIVVCAPATNQSGSSDTTTPTPPPLVATETSTASGYPATAVMGTPADSVIYGLENLYPDGPPHVVLSGINEGQNVGNWKITGDTGLLSGVSGTVGAAKTAGCLGVPALASSQGAVEEGGTLDYPAGVTEVLAWLEEHRAALLTGDVPLDPISSINIPSCETGSIRGRAEVPLATENPNMYDLNGPQDCESTAENPSNDFEAFFNGYVSITPIPINITGTCDRLEN